MKNIERQEKQTDKLVFIAKADKAAYNHHKNTFPI